MVSAPYSLMTSFKGFIVSETHWDREWYLSFQEFRKWLVKMVDDLLDNLPKNPDYKSFMMDGQTIVLEDYLEIRPERQNDLYNLIRQKRIHIGPFYVLADEFLESGEGIIRNLLLGHKISQKVGVQPMKVGYVPDTFGHIWQMPQILNGFGIESMYYYRGYPPVFGNWEEYKGKNEDTPLEHWYQSPDGSKVLTLHHIMGYGNAAGFTDNPQPIDDFPYYRCVQQMAENFTRAVPRLKSNLILFMNGTDHRQAEWLLPDLIKRWNAHEELQEDFPVLLQHSTMAEYFAELRKLVDDGLDIPLITGEARGSAYTQVTPGCISTRMNLKLMNWECSRELERYAEPLSTMSWLCGAQYQGAYIEHGWKWLIQNHPHDSICGCSLDRVHADMITRFYWSLDNASDVANYSCASILTGIDIEKFKVQISEKLGTKPKLNEIIAIGVFNTNAFNGPFVVEDYISLNPARSYKLYTVEGVEISAVTIETIPDFRANIEKGQYLYKRFQHNYALGKVTAILDNIPACGYKLLFLVGIDNTPHLPVAKQGVPKPISTDFYNVEFNPDGSLNVLDKKTGFQYKDVNTYEDGPDDGDEYDWAPLPGAKIYYTKGLKADYSIKDENIVFTEIVAKLVFPVPYELIGDADTKRVRSDQKVDLNLTTTYRIYKSYPRIDISTNVTNKAKGHRLRALIPSGITVTHSYADDHFQVLARTVALPKDDGWYQDMQGIYHQDTFVDLNDGKQGIAVFNHGICEFECILTPDILNSKGNAIALTLYRSVAWLSQKGHLGRKSGLNGPNLQTPGAQLMDHTFQFEYALFPHIGTWENAKVYQYAYAFNAPPRFFSEKHGLRNEILTQKVLSPEMSFLEISNPNLILSAWKRSSTIFNAVDGTIIRIFNPTASSQEGIIKLPKTISEAKLTNLLEEDLSALSLITVDGSKSLKINCPPYKIMTFRLK
jgi:alpha-mannosidase